MNEWSVFPELLVAILRLFFKMLGNLLTAVAMSEMIPSNNLHPPLSHLAHKTSATWWGGKTVKTMASLSPADPTTNTIPADSTKTVNVRIKGTVQGVFYRNWTMETARKLGLDGWVRNRRDGSVEAVFAGKPTAVDNMVESCRIGPPSAVVTNVIVQPVTLTVTPGFEKRPTE
eukprot:c18502_g1_i1 orf=68-586(+)